MIYYENRYKYLLNLYTLLYFNILNNFRLE